jgi:aspartyl-tRNA(Asn)/glutamyl-tRNA(Gln) amidotransferase subunit A
MFHAEIPDLTAAREQVAAGRLTTSELAALGFSRYTAYEPTVRAFLHVDWEQVLAADASRARLPLAGAPTGIKDLADVAGMPTTGGSRAYRWVASADAPAVKRWRDAGAAIVGKTNTQELAFGVFTPPTVNPWNPAHIPGGSSGGSAAALASGMVLAALGTDTGGSVRIPAACCGVVGFKPTYGQVPVDGIMPLSYTCDHVGPLAHSVRDAAGLYRLLAARPEASGAVGEFRRRAGVPWTYLADRLDTPVQMGFDRALDVFRDAGWTIAAVDMEPWDEWLDLQLTLRLPEAYLYHREVLEGPRRALLGGDLAERLDPGRTMPATRYVAARLRREALQRQWTERVRDVDVVLMPTLPVTAPKVGQRELVLGGRTVTVWEALISLTAPWNVLGWPALSVPMGLAADGLPMGLQIIGRWGEDEAVLALGAWFEDQVGPLVPDLSKLGRRPPQDAPWSPSS